MLLFRTGEETNLINHSNLIAVLLMGKKKVYCCSLIDRRLMVY